MRNSTTHLSPRSHRSQIIAGYMQSAPRILKGLATGAIQVSLEGTKRRERSELAREIQKRFAFLCARSFH